MKIGILGSGSVGQTLALGFENYGYQVMIGSRSSKKLTDWKNSSHFKGFVGNFGEAAAFGDLIVLAVKGIAAEEVLRMSGKENHLNKIVIDTTNPIANAAPVHGVLQFFTNQNNSLMEHLQTEFPHLRLVKAFSCVGAAHMVNPVFPGGKPSMFICGNDAEAKKEVKKILDLFGFETEDMGNAEAARAIEPLCILWCIPGLTVNSWNHAFKLLKK
jgi:predicted dinucleotide-binding enzyme